jgi:hypothetical protein
MFYNLNVLKNLGTKYATDPGREPQPPRQKLKALSPGLICLQNLEYIVPDSAE